MSELGQSRPSRAGGRSGYVRYAAESGSISGCRDRRLRVDVAALEMIQSSKPEPRIMRHELSDYELTAIKPMLPNNPGGVRRVNDRRVLKASSGFYVRARRGAT
jgi:hypothetical protein